MGVVLAQASADKLKQELGQIKQETVDVAAWTGKFLTEWGLRLVGVLLVLIGAWFVGAWARRTLYKALNRPHFDQTLVRFLSNTARWAVLVVGFVASLTIFGIAPTSLAAIVGAAGLAVGLAMQGSLSNLAAGIMLLLLRPFNVGDTIVVAGQTGKVDDIELFTTKLDTADNRRVILPNGQIFGSVIENLTHHRLRSVGVNVHVGLGADVDRTREVLTRAAGATDGRADDPAPVVTVVNLGASGVEWRVEVWAKTEDLGPVRQSLVRAVKRGLDEAAIGVGLPQMEVAVRGDHKGTSEPS